MSRTPNVEADIVLETAIGALTSERLLAFLSRQRWFGAKGDEATAAEIVDWVPLAAAGAVLAIARIRVETSSGRALYQLPIAARRRAPVGLPPSAVIATLDDASGAIVVVDALHDPEFHATLLRGLVEGLERAAAPGPRWVIERAAIAFASDATDRQARLVGVEQSNTSIVIGDVAIIKLFRRLVPGIHPDVEVSRFLTTASFTHTPAFLGELRFEDEQETTIAGMTQQFVPGAIDLWAHALDRSRPYFAASEKRDAPNDFLADAKRLGVTTREMHAALADSSDDPAFAPEPVSHDDVDRWAQRAQQSIREAFSLLERQVETPTFPSERVAEARALLGRREHFTGWVNEIADTIGDDLGARTRIHGDFHLGQVLRAPSGELLIIDFEGEPAKPIDERREKTSPLRDVAGMLRSFAYAAATLATEAGSRLPPHIRELRAGRWERDVRDAFLDGYLAPTDDVEDIPEDPTDTRRLIRLFETEKAFYELSYELNNRPTWAWIPMRGITKLSFRESTA